MFALAHLSLLRLEETTTHQIALAAARILQQTSLHLTQGQFLDMSYENRCDLKLSDYWPMVGGKTAALLAACTELGALVADADEDRRQAFASFGRSLGLAFQAQDDLLGIWGAAELTGKSAESDLVAGKKSLPVLYGLEQNGRFAERWRQGPILAAEVPVVAAQLEAEGARTFTQQSADRLTGEALESLEQGQPAGEGGDALVELAHYLLKRHS
jgi:geranylgeranyl diphosphate synthase type I